MNKFLLMFVSVLLIGCAQPQHSTVDISLYDRSTKVITVTEIITFRGGRYKEIKYTIDGVPNTYSAVGTASCINTETIYPGFTFEYDMYIDRSNNNSKGILLIEEDACAMASKLNKTQKIN